MKTLGILLAVIVVGIVAYKLAYPTTVYRFRITVNVDTPRGLETGSSVLEVRHLSYPAIRKYSGDEFIEPAGG